MVSNNRREKFYSAKLTSSIYSDSTVICEADPALFLSKSRIMKNDCERKEFHLITDLTSKCTVSFITLFEATLFIGFEDGSFQLYFIDLPQKPFIESSRSYSSSAIISACLTENCICTLNKSKTLTIFSYSLNSRLPRLVYTQSTTFKFDLLHLYFEDLTRQLFDQYDQPILESLVMITSSGISHPLKMEKMEISLHGILSTETTYSIEQDSRTIWRNESEICSSSSASTIEDRSIFFTGHSNNTIGMFEIHGELENIGTHHGHSSSITALCFENGILYSAGRDRIRVWDVKNIDLNLELLPIYDFGLESLCSPNRIVNRTTELVVFGESVDGSGIICTYDYNIQNKNK